MQTMVFDVFWLGLALLTTVGGMGLLYCSWRGYWPHAGVARVLWGWSVLLLSLVCWVLAGGAEFGVALGLMVPALAAWGWLLLQVGTETRRGRRRPEAGSDALPAGDDTPRLQRWLGHAGHFMLVVPLAACAAMLCSVVVAAWLPFGELNNMILAVFLVPVVWGVLAYWLLADSRRLRPIIVTSVATALAAVLVGY